MVQQVSFVAMASLLRIQSVVFDKRDCGNCGIATGAGDMRCA